jgi:hypothetical protein
VEYLLLRQHLSALALSHHQVSHCVSEETIHCGIHIAHIIQRDLVLLTIISGHVINEISLDDMSYVNTTLYSLL